MRCRLLIYRNLAVRASVSLALLLYLAWLFGLEFGSSRISAITFIASAGDVSAVLLWENFIHSPFASYPIAQSWLLGVSRRGVQLVRADQRFESRRSLSFLWRHRPRPRRGVQALQQREDHRSRRFHAAQRRGRRPNDAGHRAPCGGRSTTSVSPSKAATGSIGSSVRFCGAPRHRSSTVGSRSFEKPMRRHATSVCSKLFSCIASTPRRSWKPHLSPTLPELDNDAREAAVESACGISSKRSTVR